MSKVTMKVNQQLDKCGDEFLDERDFEIEFDLTKSVEHVICTIDNLPDCYIKKTDLILLGSYLSMEKKLI